MAQGLSPEYTRYHPRWHRKRIPIFWWVMQRSYMKFIMRELTSVLVTYASLLLLAQVWVLGREPEAYQRFQALLAHPLTLGFHVLVLAGLLFHTVTWLNLAPRALAVRLGGRRVSKKTVLVAHYLGWAAASALILWLLTGVA